MRTGTHICIDLFGCKRELLNDVSFLRKLIRKTIKEANLRLIGKVKLHKFNPIGVTGYALLSSSHISIHTWPEYGYASIDIFVCNEKKKAEIAAKIFIEALKTKKVKKIILRRGYVNV